MAKFKYTHTFEAANLAEAQKNYKNLTGSGVVVVPVEEDEGESLDLYLILNWESDSFDLTVVDTWTEVEVGDNSDGWEDAIKAAKTKYSNIRVVILTSRGLSEVFNVPRVGGGTAKDITG